MLPLASTRTRKKSCAIIAALGEICGLAVVGSASPGSVLSCERTGRRFTGRVGVGLWRADDATRCLGGSPPVDNPADQLNAWKKQVVLCEHELPGTVRHNPLAYLQNRTVDWLDHQLATRELLDIDPAEIYLVVEHMVIVHGQAVFRMDGGGGSTDQHGPG